MRLLAIIAATAAVVAASALTAHGATRACGQVTTKVGVGEGSAHHILATRVSCRRARSVARSCVRDRSRGWDVFAGAERRFWGPRFILRHGEAQVSFYVAGGGGCFRP